MVRAIPLLEVRATAVPAGQVYKKAQLLELDAHKARVRVTRHGCIYAPDSPGNDFPKDLDIAAREGVSVIEYWLASYAILPSLTVWCYSYPCCLSFATSNADPPSSEPQNQKLRWDCLTIRSNI